MKLSQIIAALGGATLLIALGCQSTPLRNPPGTNVKLENVWLKDYKWARLNSVVDAEKSCAIFTRLSKDPKFPVRELAQLRSIEVCPGSEMPQVDRVRLPAFLQDLATDILMKLSTDRGDKVAQIELAVEKSKAKLPQNEKLKWMKIAVDNAKELKMEDRLNELNERVYSIAPPHETAPGRKTISGLCQRPALSAPI